MAAPLSAENVQSVNIIIQKRDRNWIKQGRIRLVPCNVQYSLTLHIYLLLIIALFTSLSAQKAGLG